MKRVFARNLVPCDGFTPFFPPSVSPSTLSIDGKPAGELNGVLAVQAPGKSDGNLVVKEQRTYTHTFTIEQ